MSSFQRVALASCLALSACSSSTTQVPPAAEAAAHPEPSQTTGGEAPPVASAQPSPDRARELLTAALACWTGGMWAEAEGASENERISAVETNCRNLAAAIYGEADQPAYERVRALDAGAVAALRAKIDVAAQADRSHSAEGSRILALLDAIAAAEREAMHARSAADAVKRDIAVAQPEHKRKADESASVSNLREASALAKLQQLEVGELDHEARAVAALCALDRMQTARGLPTHLKFYALGPTFAALFGVEAPAVASDSTKPVKGGIWLSYLMDVARAAGHPVPEKSSAKRDDELMAWGGVFMGLADRLRIEAEPMPEPDRLRTIVLSIARKLETEYSASANAIEQAPKPAN